MNSSRQYRTSRSLSPPKGKDASREQDDHTCDRCHKKKGAEDKKTNMTDKSQQTRITHEKTQDHQQWRYAANGRRPSSRQACLPADGASRNTRQANMMCTKHEKEKAKMQATIEKLQEAFCDKESKLQDTKSQLVRERRMAEIMERQLKNARNLSEQLGRIIHDREQEIRTLKNLLNKRQDSSRNPQETAAVIRANRQAERRRSTSKDDFQASMRRSSSTSDHTECPSLSSTSVDKMLKEVHSLIDGLKIKDEAIKGLQEECTRRLDKIQILQRSIQMLQDQITQNTQHHNTVTIEKDNMITQLQHSLKESEDTVQSLLSEKTKVVIEGENTIQELQDIIQQKDVMIKRIQNQLEEALESKENELLQLRDALESRQRDLEAKQRDLEEAHEELFRSQMEGEALKMELNQEKCSLNKMSEEINSLVEKLTMAVQEMELTKQEYHKKEEKLKHTQSKMQEMCVMLLGDQDIIEKLQSLYQARRQLTGRKVLSEEDVIERILRSSPRNFYDLNEKSMSKMGSMGLSNQQIHKQQLAELQQQVNDSQAVCSILQDQLKEVTDFLDQLLHIDISPKNLPALSLIRHYGKHLRSPSNVLSKERVAPDGVSSNSQLDIEFSRQTSNEVEDQLNESNGNDDEASNFVIEAHHASIENMSFYGQAARNFYINQRSASAGDRLDTTTQSITSTQEMNENDFKEAPISVSVQGASSESDEIILLLNDREANQATSSDANRQSRKLSRPQVSSPPFPRGLKITENYGSDGSINTRENSSNVIERSVSFGSFSDSVLMSYEQSERGASDESSGMVNNRCVRSIDMMDLIPVGNNEVKPGVFLSSDSDIWSEPDTSLSRRRMGLYVEETPDSSEHSSTYVSDDLQKKKLTLPSRCESRKSRNIIHVPTKKTANKVRRWLEKLKNYLRMFEEANFHLTDEINNLCDVRNQMLALLSTEDRVDNSDAILQDLAEYIRLNFLMQKKLEKSIHFNRQLIDVFQRNISCQRKSTLDSPPVKPNPPRHPSRQKKNAVPKRTSTHCEDNPVVSDPTKPYESANIHSQLVGYHATLMSCQDMIKDLHSQLKDRHCNEIINKQELNRTVYNYLEDIDHCIDDLCKKMETTSDNSPNQNYAFNQVFGNGVLPDEETEDIAYENTETYSSPLMEKLKENEERLLRFEVLLNDKEQQLKMSAENALQLEEQLNSIKQSLYEIQMENLELKECLELSENKQLEMEDSSNQMLRELQMTMQRLSDLEERFRCLNDEQFVQKELDKSLYPMQYNYQNGSTWEDEAGSESIPSRERANSTYSRNWESENY